MGAGTPPRPLRTRPGGQCSCVNLPRTKVTTPKTSAHSIGKAPRDIQMTGPGLNAATPMSVATATKIPQNTSLGTQPRALATTPSTAIATSRPPRPNMSSIVWLNAARLSERAAIAASVSEPSAAWRAHIPTGIPVSPAVAKPAADTPRPPTTTGSASVSGRSGDLDNPTARVTRRPATTRNRTRATR